MEKMNSNYLSGVRKQFQYYKLLGERTFEQLEEEELFWQYNDASNSIAIVVNHLWGNMMSRWTDFLTSDGEKQWRERDLEFEVIIKDKEQLLNKWNEGWQCLFTALDSITDENFDTIVYIRNQGHNIPDAINRQLAHYAYHIGQIVYVGRMIQNDKWTSLSIPKGASKSFNEEKFAKSKHTAHFTDEFIEKKSDMD